MSPKRAVLLMRLAVYGTVLVLAAGVYALRASRSPDDAGAHTAEAQLAGHTSERLPVHMSLEDGEIRRLRVHWRMSCENGPRPPSGIVFSSDYGDRFERRGTTFRVGGRETHDVGGGESVLYVVEVSGRVDGNAAEGRGRLTETWLEGDRVVDRCRSQEISWQVGRGMPAGTLES